MASIRPFRALRPVPDVAPRVSSVPYDVVSTEEARAQADGNPLSFLHVTRPEIDLPPGTDPHSDPVYAQAVRNFEELKQAAPLVLEPEPSFYFYRLGTGSHQQTGLAACYSLDEYDQGLIKKHEHTRRDKEDDRTRHMIDLRAQTGVVFLTYRASAEVDAIAGRACMTPPLYEFTAADGVTHTLWRVDAEDGSALAAAFGHLPALYIADGHHRAASAARARSVLREKGNGTGELDTMLAVAFPDDQVQILPYNRIVKDLAGQSPEAFLSAVEAKLPVRPGGPSPARQGETSMYLGGRWYTLDLGAVRPPGADRIGGLDVSLLQRAVLAEILMIGDVRSDPRIDFVGGARGTAALEQAVNGGRAAVAFSMFPVTVDDLMAIADAGGIMPPKSTWFEPKLRDGLLVHLI
ncbi:MAG TPA: DUF1015 family protein [Thermoanaerobaculia bacterium]|jgi:uncharacterized protein (DUF1015 family)|nr:DUF1015 family protein [Thermoanaerobaculia bacterium]